MTVLHALGAIPVLAIIAAAAVTSVCWTATSPNPAPNAAKVTAADEAERP